MPSTYTTRLRVELQATGENDTTWGTKANSTFQHLEDAIAGYVQVSLGTSVSSSYTLSAANAATDEARMHMLKVDGQLASAITLYMPAAQKSYWVYNNTSGSTLHLGVNGAGVVSVTAGWSKVATDGSAVWLLAVPPTTYLNETSAGLIFAKLSANQSITGGNVFTSTVAFWAPVSASTLNVTEKVSTSSLNVAAITSTSTLVATSASIAALAGTQLTYTSGTITNFVFTSAGGTNVFATSISSNAVYASIMYVGGSIVLTSALLPSSGSSLGKIQVSIFTAGTGTWTWPSGVSVVLVQVVGGGGDGGSAIGGIGDRCGGGGGGGGMAIKLWNKGDNNLTYSVGGAATASYVQASGVDICRATGGTAGTGNVLGALAAGGAGGVGTVGDLLIGGGSGSYGFAESHPLIGGAGGSSPMGGGGGGVIGSVASPNQTGYDGGAIGGGGGGACSDGTSRSGGSGKSGMVKFTWVGS